jgi:hypothetical protein
LPGYDEVLLAPPDRTQREGGMSNNKHETWRRARRQAAIDAMAYREPQPTKDALRRMIAEAAANTPASADSGAAVRIAGRERRV